MSLADIVGHARLGTYAVVAMILFMVAFLLVVAWVFWPSRRRELEEARRLPLEDDQHGASRPGAES
ncbi:MAG TPA: CcoQ/FixQ family Cbb3-type cytochrome c oxidase assembly chaperone [Candidatus Saccharimonadales bacterium]|nr:CcoQ/FixQ family Cbb3-type cytochrome c oxidase assembly chaperone [Candidatus Saccharimonadales bacterium]